MSTTMHDATRYLQRVETGDKAAAADLLPLVYSKLRALAGHYVRRESRQNNLQATSLVHEAYVRLVDQNSVSWQGRTHFFGVAARAMRQVLVAQARDRNAQKRGGGWQRVTFRSADFAAECNLDEILDLDEALTKLAVLDERQSRIVEGHFFGGLTFEEIGAILGVSAKTVAREWRIARAWLSATLQKDTGSNAGEVSTR